MLNKKITFIPNKKDKNEILNVLENELPKLKQKYSDFTENIVKVGENDKE